MSAGEQFVADLESMVIGAEQKMQGLARQVIQGTCEQVVQNSPVLTGFFRGNWQPSLNQPPPAQAELAGSETTQDADKLSDKSRGMLALLIAQFKLGQVFWFVNNTVYGPRLENGFTGRDSAGREIHQRGRFFIRNALQSWRSRVAQAAVDLRMQMR